LNAAADLLDKTIAGVEEPISTIGQDIVAVKKDDIAKVMSNHIVTSKVDGAVELCKGPENAISDYIVTKASRHVTTQLLLVIDEVLNDHKGIKAWDVAIVQYNQVIESVAALNISHKIVLKPIQLDMKDYICEQTVLAIGKEMGKEEAKIRQSPQGKSSDHPDIFFRVFNGDKLMQKDVKASQQVATE